MNTIYEYDVSTTPGGSIVRRITEVEPNGICYQILAQVFDTVEQQSRDALVKLGWTPPRHEDRRNPRHWQGGYGSSPDPRIRALERRKA